MNDEQAYKLIKTLADAFDRAATTCSHKAQAAVHIQEALRKAGFVITMKKAEKARKPRTPRADALDCF